MSFFPVQGAKEHPTNERKKNTTKQTFRDSDNLLTSLATNRGKAIPNNKRTHMYPRSKTKMQIKLEQLWSLLKLLGVPTRPESRLKLESEGEGCPQREETRHPGTGLTSLLACMICITTSARRSVGQAEKEAKKDEDDDDGKNGKKT